MIDASLAAPGIRSDRVFTQSARLSDSLEWRRLFTRVVPALMPELPIAVTSQRLKQAVIDEEYA